MKNISILFLIFLFSKVTPLAQAPSTEWIKIFDTKKGGVGYAVEQTSDGGYIMTGYIGTNTNWFDVWIIKTDAKGDTLWTKTYDNNQYPDEGRSIKQTSDGGYIITGNTGLYSPTEWDVWLLKTDASGDTLWTKIFGGDNYDISESVQQTNDGGYIIAGYKAIGSYNNDVYLIKTDAFGSILWTKTIGGSDEVCHCIQQTTDSGYIIAGTTTAYDVRHEDVWLIKTNSSGDTIWTKTYGGNGAEEGSCVEQTSDGGYILTGYTTSFSSNSRHVWLIKTDSAGDTSWTKLIGKSTYDGGSSVKQTSDGGYIIIGYTYFDGSGGDAWLIKTNAHGDTLWTKTFGGSQRDDGFSVKQTNDGGYIFTGLTIIPGEDFGDSWLIKVASDPVDLENDSKNDISFKYTLEQNYPNPFNPTTHINYSWPYNGRVIIKVFDIFGRELTTLVDEDKIAGSYRVKFNGDNFASGVYLYQIKAGDFIQVKKMVLMK